MKTKEDYLGDLLQEPNLYNSYKNIIKNIFLY
jgi:hypothetical protein